MSRCPMFHLLAHSRGGRERSQLKSTFQPSCQLGWVGGDFTYLKVLQVFQDRSHWYDGTLASCDVYSGNVGHHITNNG